MRACRRALEVTMHSKCTVELRGFGNLWVAGALLNTSSGGHTNEEEPPGGSHARRSVFRRVRPALRARGASARRADVHVMTAERDPFNVVPLGTDTYPSMWMVSRDDDLTEQDDAPPSLQERGGRCIICFWRGGAVAQPVPNEGVIVVGRAKECDVAVDHRLVSRKHVALHSGPNVLIEDLGSSNGTWLNGVRLTPHEPVPLGHGGVVTIGGVMLTLHNSTPGVPSLAALAEGLGPPGVDAGIVVADQAMRRLYQMVEMVARSNLSVVLLGETGSGKEVVATALHKRSPRAAAPLVKLNCAALPENLLESELFGYERGAFTGAQHAKPGLLESADGGSVFLDEVGELPLATQAKLLRALETREVTRLGALKPRTVDVRFVSATHRDLEKMIAEGRFREDLYFRLCGIALSIPPLRERQADLPHLARTFVRDVCAKMGRAELTLSGAALDVLREHAWPGNVRELRNVIERGVTLCAGTVLGPEHVMLRATMLPLQTRPAAASESDSSERQAILDALDRTAGNQTEAAKLLGIARRTLINRITALGIPRPRKR
jgi:two-component system, NtrC family, response regulator AtoC